MEPFTLDRSFHKRDVIDGFSSIIWTERYYGDSEVEIVVPATPDMIQKFPVGTFLGLDHTREVMILETVLIKDSKLKASGISLLPWLNNRFIRVSASHEDRYWALSGMPAGRLLWEMVYSMCVEGSPYLNGTINIGVADPQKLAIPGLILRDFDDSGPNISVGIPYGPLYTAMREIATTFEIGMQMLLDEVFDTSFNIAFRTYKGLDRTSNQTEYPPVRFSPQMESFTDIEELQSIAALKTLVYAFAPGLNPEEGEPDLRTTPGVSALTGPQYTGFDLRALLVFADDITTDMVAGSPATVIEILNNRAHDAVTNNPYLQTVDGEIVPDNQFKYGVHYNLGDVIEVQGNSGIVQTARVTEYIRAQDEAGERAYPTVSMIG